MTVNSKQNHKFDFKNKKKKIETNRGFMGVFKLRHSINANLQLCEYAYLIPVHHSQSNTIPVCRSVGKPSYLKNQRPIKINSPKKFSGGENTVILINRI